MSLTIFGQNVMRFAKERGLSQAAVGELTDIDPSLLSKILREVDGRKPNADHISRLSSRLGVPPSELTKDTEYVLLAESQPPTREEYNELLSQVVQMRGETQRLHNQLGLEQDTRDSLQTALSNLGLHYDHASADRTQLAENIRDLYQDRRKLKARQAQLESEKHRLAVDCNSLKERIAELETALTKVVAALEENKKKLPWTQALLTGLSGVTGLGIGLAIGSRQKNDEEDSEE